MVQSNIFLALPFSFPQLDGKCNSNCSLVKLANVDLGLGAIVMPCQDLVVSPSPNSADII